MYEDQTFENILERMLDRVPDDLDKREGSMIYNALAPAAWELAEMYIELDTNINLSYADTATGEFLTRRAAEFGVNREPATFAQRKGLFYGSGDVLIDVPIGSRYSLNDVIYTVTSRIGLGTFILTAETAGIVGNQDFGPMLPVDYVDGLVQAVLDELIKPGVNEETDDALRARYSTAVNEQPFGGNVADYKFKISAIDGVGGVKVYPAWQGGGTVKVSIIASGFVPPSTTLVNEVQTMVDPVTNSGQGLGLAPIGHQVTVVGVTTVSINVSATLTLAPDATIGQVQQGVEDAINEYLLLLRQGWANESGIIVRVAQLESRILTVPGVVDVMNTQVNGSSSNLTLTGDQIPVLGTVTLNE
ncbi:baseplate J/gp47 family protein [Paenibacillus polysaccharolyticus]|uniref:baseplate J/gp47 family protein n=1 Tax=Paenibacillus polysaccharolyticus TaxID=582692 RepID=UPI0020424AE6|nr:baseplate J/gp47 family protein [Paenibacillus polysaccharolyticus]MCM3131910.1 baseplate J/gp47 family protein [Paenibacillus polysaccharolyticus]